MWFVQQRNDCWLNKHTLLTKNNCHNIKHTPRHSRGRCRCRRARAGTQTTSYTARNDPLADSNCVSALQFRPSTFTNARTAEHSQFMLLVKYTTECMRYCWDYFCYRFKCTTHTLDATLATFDVIWGCLEYETHRKKRLNDLPGNSLWQPQHWIAITKFKKNCCKLHVLEYIDGRAWIYHRY